MKSTVSEYEANIDDDEGLNLPNTGVLSNTNSRNEKGFDSGNEIKKKLMIDTHNSTDSSMKRKKTTT